ncbi:hypothetical protein JHK87_027888 [Glycine soja]|nr:hypothetical protein JHK87_027888 [Glycine soja]
MSKVKNTPGLNLKDFGAPNTILRFPYTSTVSFHLRCCYSSSLPSVSFSLGFDRCSLLSALWTCIERDAPPSRAVQNLACLGFKGILEHHSKGILDSDKPRKLLEDFRIGKLITSNIHRLQVGKIEAEKMLIQMVETELEKRKQWGTYKGGFRGQSHFFGIPIWYDVKLLTVAWLVLPQFAGAAYLYERFVREHIRKYITERQHLYGNHQQQSKKSPNNDGKAKKFFEFVTPKKKSDVAFVDPSHVIV